MPLEQGPRAGEPSILDAKKANGKDIGVGSLIVCKLEGRPGAPRVGRVSGEAKLGCAVLTSRDHHPEQLLKP